MNDCSHQFRVFQSCPQFRLVPIALILLTFPLFGQTTPASPDHIRIKSMRLLAPTTGWVLAEDRLLWTSNEGKQWIDITPDRQSGRTIYDVSFVDSSNGWVLREPASSDPRILLELASTTDGGRSWSAKPFPAFDALDSTSFGKAASVQFLDTSHGWLMAKLVSSSNFSLGLLFATSDGGNSWTELPAPPSGDPVRFITSTKGWLIGSPSRAKLYSTSDGGHSWSAVSVSHPVGLEDAEATYSLPTFQDVHNGILPATFDSPGGRTGVLYKTQDGGTTWTLGRTSYSPALGADGSRASVFTCDSHIMRLTTDKNGATTVELDGKRSSVDVKEPLPPSLTVEASDFLESGIGWLVLSSGSCQAFKRDCSQDSRLLRTSDGGNTFTEITPQVDVTCVFRAMPITVPG